MAQPVHLLLAFLTLLPNSGRSHTVEVSVDGVPISQIQSSPTHAASANIISGDGSVHSKPKPHNLLTRAERRKHSGEHVAVEVDASGLLKITQDGGSDYSLLMRLIRAWRGSKANATDPATLDAQEPDPLDVVTQHEEELDQDASKAVEAENGASEAVEAVMSRPISSNVWYIPLAAFPFGICAYSAYIKGASWSSQTPEENPVARGEAQAQERRGSTVLVPNKQGRETLPEHGNFS
jgi:hypothetical protein